MPPKVTWGCPIIKIYIFCGTKNANNAPKSLQIVFVPNGTKSQWPKMCLFCGPKNAPPPKKKKNPKYCCATNAPLSHLEVSSDQNLHILGAKLSAPCCFKYSSLYVHLFVLQQMLAFRAGSSSLVDFARIVPLRDMRYTFIRLKFLMKASTSMWTTTSK